MDAGRPAGTARAAAPAAAEPVGVRLVSQPYEHDEPVRDGGEAGFSRCALEAVDGIGRQRLERGTAEDADYAHRAVGMPVGDLHGGQSGRGHKKLPPVARILPMKTVARPVSTAR